MANSEIPHISDFPVGNENTGYALYFSGRSWLAPLASNSDLNVPISNVTFEPGCRNNWHSHTSGQILIAVGGAGYYQERGKEAIRMESGDIVEIAPHVKHWHGAAPDSWFSHLAIACNPQTNQNTWLEPISDEPYRAATKE
ncbi:MAG: cupin domain-containing protein [Bacteroides sp.]|nr:cupin domain-containing protein [Bacteroides sp.]